MSATEDESQSLDSGWDDEAPSEPGEDEVDQAWDSLPPPVSAASHASGAPSMPPETEEVDVGWDDMPEGALQPAPGGKRRPHRQRRAKTNAAVVSTNPVLLPRPAEPSKKQQREHARKQRAYEAQVRQLRKQEKKAQRSAEMLEQAAERRRQTEAEEQARRQRREARQRAEGERPAAKASARRAEVRKPSANKPVPTAIEAKPSKPPAHSRPPRRGLRPGVVITLVLLALAIALLVLRK